MSRDVLIAQARRNLEHLRAGTQSQEAGVHRVPVGNYTDPERWQREIDRIFRRLPLVAGFTCELREPGAYRATEIAGVPILVSRGHDGELRAFVNMCSHRGAIVVEEGTGSARRFACPYHAWTYDQEGALVGIPDREDVGLEDPSCYGLTPLPVAERAGIVFVTPTPNAETTLDIDVFLAGYGEMLEHLRLDECTVVGEQRIVGPNWKVAYDGYLDFYHLPVLHKDSFGPDMSSKAIYDAWGPHQRVNTPNPKFARMADLPDDEWDIDQLTGGVWTIFPHVSIAGFDVSGKVFMVSQLSPGPDAAGSVTTQTFLFRGEPDDEQRALCEKQMAFLEQVVRDEDYATGLGIQRAISTGAKTEFVFGRNEGGGHRFHQWVDRLLDTDDADLPGLFASS
ncbi:MAG: aromatic ring-hydroxylating dioxygenase subunit alpha [Actinomycetota bacterium]